MAITAHNAEKSLKFIKVSARSGFSSDINGGSLPLNAKLRRRMIEGNLDAVEIAALASRKKDSLPPTVEG